MDELNKLRTLLIESEQKELRLLKEKIEELSTQTTDPKTIIKRISPILSSIIEKSSIKDEKLLTEALSPVVYKLIDQNFVESKDKITKQLSPLITQAIKEQIKNQKDEMVDVLYPILGNMISKYVSKTFEEMMNTINDQITNGLSFETYSRKIKAKIKGVSEAELLLNENAIASIRSVFLIHKETGIVLSHAEHEENPINEPEMIASMMTAIRSFVNEWIEQNKANHEIGTIEYGGSKIILEASGYSYLAVIVDGLVSTKTNERIRGVLENIVLENGEEIKNFNGDLSALPKEELQKKLTTLIYKNETKKKSKKTHPLIYILPILLISWLAWIFYNNHIDNSIKQNANKILYKNPKLTMYRISANTEEKVLTLKGVVPSLELKQIAQKNVENIKNIKEIKNHIIVIEQEKISLIKEKVEFLLTALNLNKDIDLKYTLNNKNELTLSGELKNKKDKKFILKQFQNLSEISSIKDNIAIIPPFLDILIYFDLNSSQIKPDEEKKLIKLIDKLSNADENLVLKVIVSNDSIGSDNLNEKLNKKRFDNVKKYLESKGKISQEIKLFDKSEITNKVYIDKKTKHDRHIFFLLEYGSNK